LPRNPRFATMFSYKILWLLVTTLFNFAVSIEVDCEIRKNPDYLRLFDTLKDYFNETSQECGFKVDSENSSEINFDFPVDEELKHVTFVYTTTSIPILPAELFEKVPDKKVFVGFYNLASIKIERDWFKHSENLTHLFFYQNRIPRLEAGKFLDLKKLKSLNLRYNFLKEIDVGAFSGLQNLNLITLSYNELEYLHPDTFRNTPSLERILLIANRLKQVTGLFEKHEDLTILNMEWNPMKKLKDDPFAGLEKLTILNIANLELTSLHPDLLQDLMSLKELYLFRNLIKELDEKVFGYLIKLEILDLSSNKLEYFPEKQFENLRSLKTLYLDRNPIKTLHEKQFENLVNLEVVTFAEAQFTTIPDGIFKNNGNLRTIVLQANINRMSNKVFSHLTKLESIFLGDNYCVALEIKEHNLSVFFTEELLIPCSCKLLVNDVNLDFKPRGFLIFGICGVSISAIFFLLLKKVKFSNSLWTRDDYLILKNGNYLDYRFFQHDVGF
jgi:Leucine-rich repeat (LRR) protein